MAQVAANIIDKINNFIDILDKSDIPVQKAILFGSYAKGNFHEWSDIDIAVISDKFTGNCLTDYDLLIQAMLKSDSSIEPHTYRPEDFTPDNLFVKEILKNGIIIR